ncbi:MAG: heparinase II/III family protein [Deltaproteobacteria bacterium]|nr:heparinase II/III family protein [Deltaproteobacteria bacterium]
MVSWVLGLVALSAEPSWTCGADVHSGSKLEGKGPLRCRVSVSLPEVDGASAVGVRARLEGLTPETRGVARIESGLHMVWLPFRAASVVGWLDQADAAYVTHGGEYDPELLIDLTDDRTEDRTEDRTKAWAISISVEVTPIDPKDGPARFNARRSGLPTLAPKVWKTAVRDQVLAAMPPAELHEQPGPLARRMRTSLAYAQPGFPEIELPRLPGECSAVKGPGFGRRVSTPECLDRFDFALFAGPSRAWRERFLAFDGTRVFVEAFSAARQREDLQAAVTLASELADRLDAGSARREEALVEIFDDPDVVGRRLLNVAALLVSSAESTPERDRLYALLHADAASLLGRPGSVADVALVTYSLLYPEVLAPSEAAARARRGFERQDISDLAQALDTYEAASATPFASLASNAAELLCELTINGRLVPWGRVRPDRVFDPRRAASACPSSGFCESICGGAGMPSPELAAHFASSDLTVLRADRASDSPVLAVRGRGAFGHADALSFVLAADGVDWLIELGEPALPENSDLLAFARARRAHNVPFRRGPAPPVVPGSTCCGASIEGAAVEGAEGLASVTSLLTSGAVTRVVLESPEIVRTLTFVRPRWVVVRDDFRISKAPRSPLELRQVFHLLPNKQIAVDRRVVRVADVGGSCLFLYAGGVGVEPVAGRSSGELQGWVFQGEQPVPAPALEVLENARLDGSGSITSYLVTTPKSAGCARPFESDLAVRAAVLGALADVALWGDPRAP